MMTREFETSDEMAEEWVHDDSMEFVPATFSVAEDNVFVEVLDRCSADTACDKPQGLQSCDVIGEV